MKWFGKRRTAESAAEEVSWADGRSDLVREEREEREEVYAKPSHGASGWLLLFCLLSVWVYAFRSGGTFLLVQSELHTQFMAVGFFEYPVQILGVCVLPWLLDRLGLASSPRSDRLLFSGLMGLGLALKAALWFTPGFWLPLCLLYLLILATSTAMGLALRRGAMLWDPNRAALYIGGAHILYYVAEYVHYYSFFLTGNPIVYLVVASILFAGLLIAAFVVRLRMRENALTATQVLLDQPYPRQFLRGALAALVLHSLFSVLVNTVWYFENDGAFPSFWYELSFKLLALVVMGAATLLLHKRRWFVLTMSCLLVLCFGQGLTLWNIENMPLAVSYNLATMAAKMPPYLLSLTVPLWYAAARRKPSVACLGFGVNTGIEVLILLTQLRPGTLGVIPRQGFLLLLGLGLVALMTWLYLKYQKIQTDELLSTIRSSQEERKTPEQTLSALNLTPREHEVAQLLLTGDSNKIIAAKLHISQPTVGFHTKNLYRKLNIQSRAELFALFILPAPGGAMEVNI